MLEIKIKNLEFMKKVIIIAASFIVVAVTVLIILTSTVDRTEIANFTIEADAGIKIAINKKDRILSSAALNDDGEIVLEKINIGGKKLDVAIENLIETMAKKGFINENENSILITVDSEDNAKKEELLDSLAKKISDFAGSKIDLSILSQELEHNSEIQALVQKHGISEGKAQYILKITDAYSTFSFDELADLSINELNLISNSSKNKLKNIEISGKPSDKQYIGRYKALSTALSYLNITESDIKNLSLNIGIDDSIIVYKIAFNFESNKYEFNIDALTCELLNRDDLNSIIEESVDPSSEVQETPREDSSQESSGINSSTQSENTDSQVSSVVTGSQESLTSTTATPTLSEDKAKNIAFDNSGFDTAKIYDLEAQFMEKDGTPCWVISFKYNDAYNDIKCKYLIKDSDGSIINIEKGIIR